MENDNHVFAEKLEQSKFPMVAGLQNSILQIRCFEVTWPLRSHDQKEVNSPLSQDSKRQSKTDNFQSFQNYLMQNNNFLFFYFEVTWTQKHNFVIISETTSNRAKRSKFPTIYQGSWMQNYQIYKNWYDLKNVKLPLYQKL